MVVIEFNVKQNLILRPAESFIVYFIKLQGINQTTEMNLQIYYNLKFFIIHANNLSAI